MTKPTDRTMAADIETAARAVPGVSTVFRAGGIISKVVDAGTQLLGVHQNEARLIRLEHAPEGLRVEVAIGVHAGASAAETSHRVHAAITAMCAGHGCTPVEVRLTVVHIDESLGDVESR